MLRGYRLYIAALGLVLTSPSYGQERQADKGKPERNTPSQLERITAAIEKQPIASTPDRGCQPGQDDRQSDLCAQWKAADAATDAAYWAQLTWVAGIIGLVIGGGTLFAAWRAAHWAKKAADHTETAATAAKDSLTHAKEMAAVQLRPYLHVDEIAFEPKAVKGRKDVAIRVKNFGSTPATDFQIEAGVERRNTGKVAPTATIKTRRVSSIDEIPPGHTATIRISGFPVVTYESDGLAYFCIVSFGYSDKFGARHTRWEIYKSEAPHTTNGAFHFLRSKTSVET